jgi:hypothetical protein
MVGGYYTGDVGEFYLEDYSVARFDAQGLLIDFKEEGNLPGLGPSLSTFKGQKILFQHKATMKKETKGPPYGHVVGTVVLTETELFFFMSNKLIANTPAELRLAYSSISEEQIKGFLSKALWVKCRTGDEYKFMMGYHDPERKNLHEAHRIIQSKLSP